VRKFGRVLLRIVAALVLLAAACAVTGVLVFRSGWFYEQVHRRMVVEIEKATGGRVEIENFAFDWKRLEIKVGPVVLHGTESASERGLPSGMGKSGANQQPSMIMRATQKKRMSKPVTRSEVG